MSALRRAACAVVCAVAVAALPAEAAAERFPAASYASVARVQVFSKPTADSKRVLTMRQLRKDGNPTVFFAIRKAERAGKTFYEIRRPYRPNNRTGWVRESQLGPLHHINTKITVDRSKRELTLRRGGRKIFRAPVAVGKSSAPTPLGRFYLTVGFRPTIGYLGAYAFETSAGASITDWPGGGVVGLHGTDQPGLIGQAVSHGCIRMRDADIQKLRRKVGAGTALRIKR